MKLGRDERVRVIMLIGLESLALESSQDRQLITVLEGLSQPVIATLNGQLEELSSEVAAACSLLITTTESVLAGLPAPEAVACGVITLAVATEAELLPTAEQLALTISRNAPLAVRHALESIKRGSRLPLSEALELEAELFSRCFATEDAREGVRAFYAKREPQFRGH
ncbi:MAG: enoyl-CoA hydratase/isomerase family protein [Deltaproteobacteria bacterium]|nr:enoyl-CoA hydratase/isomerase family protein [Deltaproteobacteria bacterium]